MNRIAFKSHPLLKKWAIPNLYGSGGLFKRIKAESMLLQKSYNPPFLCLNPIVSFLLRSKYEKSPKLKITRVSIPMSDGGTVGLDMMELQNKAASISNPLLPNVIHFPAGNETCYSTKPQTLLKNYLEAGYPRVFVCNIRGKGSTPLTSPRFTFPYGDYSDVSGVIEVLEDMYKDERWLLSGACFGGACVIDYLSSPQSNKSNIIGGVLHSIQWNLARSNELAMAEPAFSLIMKPFAREMRDKLLYQKPGSEDVQQQIYEMIGKEDVEMLKNSPMKTVEEIEQLYIRGFSPVLNYEIKNHADYFERMSPNNKFQSIRKPLVIVNAADDFAAPLDQSDVDDLATNPNICLWLFAAGGHCAYVKSLWPVTNAIDDVMVECSNIVCENMSE